MVLLYILGSVLVVSLVSLVGIFTLLIKHKYLDKIIFTLVSFAMGSLLGAAFLDLLPESFEASGHLDFAFVLFGILLFFIVEKFLFWYHCHKDNCEVHTFSYMSLIGDAIHNFMDGMIIATAFITNISLGIVTTIAIIMHEIPQELGDFGILCHGGFTKKKALFYNFLSALTAFLGAIIVCIFSVQCESAVHIILPFAAGGFIYIACTDLMPELGKELNAKRSFYQLTLMFLGIGVIWIARMLFR